MADFLIVWLFDQYFLSVQMACIYFETFFQIVNYT